ncbi:MAG TPA: acyl-CoA dehydrogenase family protein, partial [Polyangiaceae bacterium]
EQATELIGWLRDYATFRINSRVMDERRSLAPHVVLDFGNHGVLGMAVPQRYGGLELAPSDVMRVTQQLAAIDLTLASFVGVNHALGTLPIVRHGSPPLQERLLPSLASGRILAAFALTERAAGSNPLAMQATARIQADGSFRIDANKSWIGSGSWASVLNVFARTYDASGQPLGISGFAVAHDSPGVRHGEEALTLGMRAMVQNDVHFDQVRVGESELLGGVGSGMEVAQDAMNFGRLGIAAMSVGALKRCTQLMTRFAQRRRIGTGSLLENPVTVLRLSEVTASARALETLVDEACGALERGETLPAEVFAVCKVAGSELLWRAADHLVQMLGARGYTENNGATQLLRDARLLRIFEGPSETLLCFLGASLIARPTQLLSFLEQTCQAAGVARELAQAQERVVLQLAANIELENVETSPTALQFALGECITFGVLAATLKRAAGTSRAEHAEIVRSLLWAEQQFTLRLAALTPSAPRAWLVTPEQICAIAARSSDEIGDILQRLPGVEDRMDPLLTPTGSEPPATVKPAFSAALAANPVSTIGRPLPSVPVVEAWLKDWLAQHLKVNRASLRSEAAFVEYGLDSVKAVQLAADLEGWLGIRIDRTMVWDYPHIASIAQRIAGSEQAFGGSSPQPPKAGSGHDTRPELESLSEPELVALLKEELAQCK